MLARLVGNLEGLHKLQDGLESLINVLLWTALMFSECSESGAEYIDPFMSWHIDLQTIHLNGSHLDSLESES
jgi:hypothetical protein